jgi:hypothetical protein
MWWRDGGWRSEPDAGRKPSVFSLPIALVCLLTCGRGFHAVYGSHGGSDSPVAEQLNQVAIDNIPDRQGQMLRNALIDRMYGKGRPLQPLTTRTGVIRLPKTLAVGRISTLLLAMMSPLIQPAITTDEALSCAVITAPSPRRWR